MEIEVKVKEVFANNLGIKENEIKPDASLDASLALDSTELVELNVALEKAFGIKIAKDEITKDSTFNDIINKIKEKTNS